MFTNLVCGILGGLISSAIVLIVMLGIVKELRNKIGEWEDFDLWK